MQKQNTYTSSPVDVALQLHACVRGLSAIAHAILSFLPTHHGLLCRHELHVYHLRHAQPVCQAVETVRSLIAC